MSDFDFTIDPGWPEAGSPAARVTLGIVYKATGAVTPLELDAAELRSLIRAAVRGLGFTRVARLEGQWWKTWEARVDELVSPVFVIVNALLPKSRRTLARALARVG